MPGDEFSDGLLYLRAPDGLNESRLFQERVLGCETEFLTVAIPYFPRACPCIQFLD